MTNGNYDRWSKGEISSIEALTNNVNELCEILEQMRKDADTRRWYRLQYFDGIWRTRIGVPSLSLTKDEAEKISRAMTGYRWHTEIEYLFPEGWDKAGGPTDNA